MSLLVLTCATIEGLDLPLAMYFLSYKMENMRTIFAERTLVNIA
jgi:hypothetical protein